MLLHVRCTEFCASKSRPHIAHIRICIRIRITLHQYVLNRAGSTVSRFCAPFNTLLRDVYGEFFTARLYIRGIRQRGVTSSFR